MQNDTEELLDWVVFVFKFVAELTLGILEFWANKEHMKFIIAAIILAIFALIINVVEVFRSFRRKNVILNQKVYWSKLSWIP